MEGIVGGLLLNLTHCLKKLDFMGKIVSVLKHTLFAVWANISPLTVTKAIIFTAADGMLTLAFLCAPPSILTLRTC